MQNIDFSLLLSAALTPITLISGVGLLLMTMSARYQHTADRVRQLLKTKAMTADPSRELNASIALNYHRAELLRKAILFVVLSAACSGLLVFTSTIEALFGLHLDAIKHIFLLMAVGLIVVSTIYFSLEVTTSLKALEMRVHND